MASKAELQKRRQKLLEREERVEKQIRKGTQMVEHLEAELKEERKERDDLRARRQELGEALEDEIKADKRGRGDHPEHWEDWAEAKRDELADLIEASEARSDRLVERAAEQEGLLDKLEKRDRQLDARIKRIRKKIRDKQEPAGQLTPDFHVAEFGCRDGTPVPAGIVPDLKALCEQHLQPLQDSGGSVYITSGYRTRSYNASIGGASQSYHIYDLRMKAPAADHVQSGRPAGVVQQWHEAHDPFDGMGFYSGFTHGDDRGYRSRWYGAG